MLTLSDIVRDWREGKLLRPKSGVDADAAGDASDPVAPARGVAGAAGGVAAAAAAALSGQELDPAGAARALRLLFERVCGTASVCSTRKGDKNDENTIWPLPSRLVGSLNGVLL